MNENWAKQIIGQLEAQGVTKFCIAPGSRSTPLALAVAENSRLSPTVHFDERGMAFYALGYAKAAKKPAALIVTSGTAVGNILPALMEASLSQTPLIVLTADRPPELRACGANQTLDQVKLFSSYVRWEVDLPCPDPALPKGFLASTIAYAVFKASHSPKGPVHLNCMLREPFFSEEKSPFVLEKPVHYWQPRALLFSVEEWAETFSRIKKGIIVVGNIENLSPAVFSLAEKLQWPILGDITSGIRGKEVIAYAHLIKEREPPEAVLHLGDRCVAKESYAAPLYCLVADHPERYDPKMSITHRLVCDPSLFCSLLAAQMEPSTDASWLNSWKAEEKKQRAFLKEFFARTDKITEPGLFFHLQENLGPDTTLFIANSMPIRDANHYFYPNEAVGPLFANRGVSGIDGNIATASGIAEALQKPVLAVLGDQTFLHDLNSLALVKKSKFPIILLVINNGGGGIFSFLPIQEKQDVFEKFWAASHTLSFEYAAKLFDLPYFQPSCKEDLMKLLATQRSCLIEIQTVRRENYALHKEILSASCKN